MTKKINFLFSTFNFKNYNLQQFKRQNNNVLMAQNLSLQLFLGLSLILATGFTFRKLKLSS